eukprot:GSChrysophyteH1.ASY1.ANO1.2451.1 assembled CDS
MASKSAVLKRFWAWTSQKRPSWRESKTEAAVLFCVFGLTGSSSVGLVRPCLYKLGLEGSLKDGPNSYRVISILSVTPIYSVILFTLGTLSGRHAYFASQWRKIFTRFIPSKAVDKIVQVGCQPAATRGASTARAPKAATNAPSKL